MSCVIAKAAGVELRMVREGFINIEENLVTDGCNIKYLFILHVLG